MTQNRKKLFSILQKKSSLPQEKLRFVVASFSEFKVETLLRFLTLKRQKFQSWLHDQLLLKEGTIEALERQYRYLINDFEEYQDCKNSVSSDHL